MRNHLAVSLRIALVLAFLGLTCAEDLRAQSYVMFNAGNGGRSHASSGGVEFGKFFPRENPRFLLGAEFSATGNGYTSEKTTYFQSNICNEQQLAVAAGWRLFKGVYAVGTGGMSARAERDYMIVNGKKILLAEMPGTLYGSGSGQLRFVYKRFVAGAGYHSRRGVVFGFGFTFSSLFHPRAAR
jgi:hypothetical protein